MYLPWSSSRMNFYSFQYFPTVVFDGITSFVGGGDVIQLANQYRAAVNQRLGVGSPVAMHGTFTYSGSTITLTATARKTDNVTLTQPMLGLAVLEDNITSGTYTYRHVVRAGGSRAITLTSVGDSAT